MPCDGMMQTSFWQGEHQKGVQRYICFDFEYTSLAHMFIWDICPVLLNATLFNVLNEDAMQHLYNVYPLFAWNGKQCRFLY